MSWVYLAYAVAAAVLWGTIGVAYKLAVEAGADGSWVIVGRPLLASAASPIVVLATRRAPSRWSVAVGLAGLAPLYVSYFLAVERVGAGVASVLLYTAPVWVTLTAWLTGLEEPSRKGAVSVAMGVAGAWLVAGAGGSESWDALGALLGLASGVSYAAYILLARVAGLRGVPLQDVAVHSLPFAALGVYLAVRPQGAPGPSELAAAAYLAVAGTLVPYSLNAAALRRVEASRVSVVSLIEPVTAIALATLLLGERMSPVQAVGAGLVLAASALAARRG